MIEMFVVAMGKEQQSGYPVICLADRNKIRFLPIVVGHGEEIVVGLAIQESQGPQVAAQDLTLEILHQCGYMVTAITLCRYSKGTFYASLRLVPLVGGPRSSAYKDVSCRVHEALALGVRTHLPVLVAEEILAALGIPADPDQERAEAEKFKNFIEHSKPSDFRLTKAKPL
jgi:bifunctional DNase/RNase